MKLFALYSSFQHNFDRIRLKIVVHINNITKRFLSCCFYQDCVFAKKAFFTLLGDLHGWNFQLQKGHSENS